MKNMFRNAILLAALVAIVAPAQVFAADEPTAPPPPPPARERSTGAPSMGGGGQGMRGMGGMRSLDATMMFQGLDLTEEQKAKMAEIQKASAEKAQAAQQAQRQAMMKVTSLAMAGAAEADVRAAATEYGKAYADASVLTAKTVAEMKALLTPEQLTKFEELVKQRQEMRNQTQEGRREVRTREGRPTPPPAPAPQN